MTSWVTRTSAALLLATVQALLLPAALAQDAPKEKVLRGADVTTDGLVEALDVGAPRTRGLIARGFKPAETTGAAVLGAGDKAPVGGQAGSGKAPLMVTFNTGSAELSPESVAVMAKLAQALQSDRLARLSFVVEGHADPRGDEQMNQRLSQARAESVMRHLVQQHGIPASRLSSVGKGSSELHDTVRIDAPENRRVTIVTQRP
jgi:outer membrane protein OmpA-like peptidoglycan-associated protein